MMETPDPTPTADFPGPAESAAVALSVELEARPTVNFAMQQNDVPILLELRARNTGSVAVKDIELQVTCEPAFAEPLRIQLESVAPGALHQIATPDYLLSPHYLVQLTERVGGVLRAEARAPGCAASVCQRPIEILAYDEWSGIHALPEILAAFVMPNHPAVERLLGYAADILAEATGDGSLSGYQRRDGRRVLETLAAIYHALRKCSVRYVNPPASFETAGQKIRTPDRILENRLGTCLDLSVLAAACIEQAGLNPLIVITEGHAFVGAWLVEDCFPDCATDDCLRIRKRVELGEIRVFESTTLAADKPARFDQAVEIGRRHLDDPAKFRCAIDIRRARISRIRPLPLRGAEGLIQSGQAFPPSPTAASASVDVSRIALPRLSATGSPRLPDAAPTAETPATRVDRWKRKLLDLSLHNRLINFKKSARTLPVLCPDLGALEDTLAEGESIQLHPRPVEMGDRSPRSGELYFQRTGKDALSVFLREELSARRLHAAVTKEDLQRRLLEIYRTAQTNLQEGGANTLYLALGFLRWYEDATSTQERLAPLILVPLELIRKSVQEGFTLTHCDEDVRVNVTLLELLQQDFQVRVEGVNPLPRDEHGIDVNEVFLAFRRAVRDIDRWEVVEDAEIGNFSFTKFLMWRDMVDRADALCNNKVVNHLIHHPNESFPDQGDFPDHETLDARRSPAETYCPLSSDSSQLAAVFSAAEGKCFVLEGPPGTGKSQTIANLIAHNLTLGRKVLFISEKMAALNVVYHRLQQCGLSPFCLEVHSNKSHKKRVLAQLAEPLELAGMQSPAEWERETQRLHRLRTELNQYVEALHRCRPIGLSVFQMTSRMIALREVEPVSLGWTPETEVDRARLELHRESVDRMTVAVNACGAMASHPWKVARCENWSSAFEREVLAAVTTLQSATARLNETAQAAAAPLCVSHQEWTREMYSTLAEIAEILMAAPHDPPPGLALEPGWGPTERTVREWIEHGRRRDTLRRQLAPRYKDNLISLDLHVLQAQWQRAGQTWFLPRFFLRRRIRNILRTAAKDGLRPPPETVGPDLATALELLKETTAVNQAKDKAERLLGAWWNAGEADWDALEQLMNWTGSLRRVALVVKDGDAQATLSYCGDCLKVIAASQGELGPEGKTGRVLVAFRTAVGSFMETCAALESRLALDLPAAWGEPAAPGFLSRVLARLDQWAARIHDLRAWCHWCGVRGEADVLGLGALTRAAESGSLSPEQLSPTFERSLGQWWLDTTIEADPHLRGFFSAEHERKIEQFRRLDENYSQLVREEIRARLAAQVPRPDGRANENSELGILRRELQKKSRNMPIRALFQKIPQLLLRLKPCLLMSPISVAQYLDAGFQGFDLVVFDEASQIPVWDAIGAIARGRELVIVGDPKQLPPTNFFNRTDEEDMPEEDLLEDMESILDDCMAAQLPTRRLLWHYRSRHESLIAFSNYHYYENRLLTFPSPTRTPGVRLRPVPGVYDKGKTRTNRAEADAVVAEIVARLKDPQHSHHTIGVVTFSLSQQLLIEDLLEEARRANPDIEPFFSADAQEPVFVKNLENVQGDERDVILFSVCYGPDEQGRVSMNFGPLNRDGGERRLNVAITRARRELIIFSTLRSDQIDLARTRARGVHDLRNFLEYAQQGPAALAAPPPGTSGAQCESPFEEQVARCLRDRGYQVHSQVGCSDYRIDLAIVDPDTPGQYLLGIECDGANYHRSRTARDRDLLRLSVLKGLGWVMHRVWSSDWWADPEREMARIEKAIHQTIKAAKTPKKPAPETAPANPQRMEDRVQAQPGDQKPSPRGTQKTAFPLSSGFSTYKPYSNSRLKGKSEAFSDPASDDRLKRLVRDVVENEGPISLGLLAERVGEHWELKRITQAVLERIADLAEKAGVRGITHGDTVFYWPERRDPAAPAMVRIPGEDPSSRREPQDLPPEEIAAAAARILEQQGNMPRADLVRETARLFGFQRVGTAMDTCINRSIDLLVKNAAAREHDGMIIR